MKRYCPIHEYTYWYCSRRCLRQRLALRLVSHALNVYWYTRRHGARPMDLAEFRARYGR